MKLLFFDTETTGKADFRAPADAAHQPRLVQLAALLTDEKGVELASLNVIVRPFNFTIPAEAAAVHGITTEIATDCGIPVAHALLLFASLAKLSNLHVCHNVEFDLLIVSGECIRVPQDMPRRDTFCTMKRMTDVCCIPGSYGRGHKWPKLQEAYHFCFDREFSGAHDALADVRACRDIYFWLHAKQQPRVLPQLAHASQIPPFPVQ